MNCFSNYPPGTWANDPNAPWNELPEPEPRESDLEAAKAEVWFLFEWDDNSHPDLELSAVDEMLLEVLPTSYYHDVDFTLLVEAMYLVEADHGTPAALNMMPAERREEIKEHADDWVYGRAVKILMDEEPF